MGVHGIFFVLGFGVLGFEDLEDLEDLDLDLAMEDLGFEWELEAMLVVVMVV